MFWLPAARLKAQSPAGFPPPTPLRFEHLSLEAGLSQNAVLAWPGEQYVFRVKGSNIDGGWGETGAPLPVPISLSLWQTWWFGVALVLITALVLGGLYLWRMVSLKAQNRLLEQVVAQRTAEMRLAQDELAKHADTELSASEARFQAIFDSAAVGVGIMGLDGKVVTANPALCRLYGRLLDELVGQTSALVVHPDEREESAQSIANLITGRITHYAGERRYIRKNGEAFWAQVTLSLVRDTTGAPRYIVGMVVDIDEKKRAQEDLRESEARFRAMFDNAAVGMALMTLDRRVVSINQATERIIGYNLEEVRDIDPSDLSYPEDRAIGLDLFAEMVAGHRSGYQMEKRYVRKDGRVIWARVTYSVVPDEAGRPEYLIGMIEDIDEQKRASEKLAAQEAEYRRTLEQHVAERTHELAAANTRLMGEIEQRRRAEEALARKAADEAVVAERTRLARDLHDAVTQTLFSASLTAEVLPDLWAINPAEAQKSTEELRQLTRGALAEMRTLLLELRPSALTEARLEDLLRQLTEAIVGRARLPVEFAVEGQRQLPVEIKVVFYRIAQEALNNVIKYARAGQVRLDLRLQPDSARLVISDDGVGFNPETVGPTHLGLKIMRERAEAIQARLGIHSEVGHGTIITVTWHDPESEVK
jgi:two-component system nitrate/nitrite sensor histidine kinase NarX